MEFHRKPPSKVAEVSAAIWAFLNKTAITGSGSDPQLLEQHGSAQCKSKAASVGWANLAASSLGAIGAYIKTYMIVPGPLAAVAASITAAIYFILIFNLEKMLAAGISAFWPASTKLKALAGRASVTMLCTAVLQAVPWTLIAFGNQLEVRLAKFEMDARQEAKGKIEALHDIKAVDGKTAKMVHAVKEAAEQVRVLPESVVDVQQIAEKCDKDADALFASNKRKAASLQARLPALANIEFSNTAVLAQKLEAKRAREEIAARLTRLADDVAAKRAECRNNHAQAAEAKNRYITEATAKLHKVEAELDGQKRAAGEVAKAVSADVAKADEAARRGYVTNSAAEIKAAVALLSEEPYARIKALFIYFFFVVVDIACISLKLLAKPGLYDFALRKRDELARIGADQTIREAEREDMLQAVQSAAKVKGVIEFHAQDAGAAFACLERLAHDEKVRAAEQTHDIRMARAQLAEIETLAAQVEAVLQRVKGNHALAVRLNEVLAILRGTATPKAA
ncbi:DUF4407 domain-containing protein [Ramlibacter sp. RBP-2]|uniref:DUF4407 domain-containing protein n=1 Tax=Ramlibacter lithotrophicus TaxID=2606681 RepID=A0A7X6DGQ3_9BURK|nr:DUF4407 domain-containing protein [Ramlibacter lithotrophicus]NKE66856.1 DUF4407 domain-containing protein [Ramlibacter lithotrophicus]